MARTTTWLLGRSNVYISGTNKLLDALLMRYRLDVLLMHYRLPAIKK